MLKRLVREEQGNTVILLTVICLMFVGSTLLSLDVFSVLISRRYAQTDADASALGAVQAMQPIVMDALLAKAEAKVNRLINEAKQEWEDEGAEGSVTPYITRRLAEVIPDAHVVRYILGQAEEPPSPQQLLTAVLTAKERGCAVQQATDQALKVGQASGWFMIRERTEAVNKLQLEFPYGNRPVVAATVSRMIPTVFLHKVTGHVLHVDVGAAATLSGLRDVELDAC